MALPFMQIALALADLVPTVGHWFSGHPEESGHSKGVAGKIVDIARRITKSDDPTMALEALRSKPELLLEFQRDVLEMDRDLERAFLLDRQDARARDQSFVTTGRYNIRADIMVLAAAFGLLACLLALAYYKETLPGEAVGIISTVAGIFGSCLKDAYSFEFGSSRGSKEKDMSSLFKGRLL
jgi:hypothetical protein